MTEGIRDKKRALEEGKVNEETNGETRVKLDK